MVAFLTNMNSLDRKDLALLLAPNLQVSQTRIKTGDRLGNVWICLHPQEMTV